MDAAGMGFNLAAEILVYAVVQIQIKGKIETYNHLPPATSPATPDTGPAKPAIRPDTPATSPATPDTSLATPATEPYSKLPTKALRVVNSRQ